jgi:hypothetical protein
MSLFYSCFRDYLADLDGRSLGVLLDPTSPDNQSFAYSTNHHQIRSVVNKELYGINSFRGGITEKGQKAWMDAVIAYWEVVYELERGDTARRLGEDGDLGYWGRAYLKQSNFTTCVSPAFPAENEGADHWIVRYQEASRTVGGPTGCSRCCTPHAEPSGASPSWRTKRIRWKERWRINWKTRPGT